jgi:hypothetical protein
MDLINNTVEKNSNCRTDECKKNRYINEYYRCRGCGCNHDFRKLPNLFIPKSKPQTIKSCWLHLSLEPKYYNNYCKICDFLKSYNLNKNTVNDLIDTCRRSKDNKLDKFLTHEQEFLKNHSKYKELLTLEKKEIDNLRNEVKKTCVVDVLEQIDRKFKKMENYYQNEIDILKKRIEKLENKNITVTKTEN